MIESMPSLSTVIGEFLELASREYFTAKDFEKVLIKDQALVARLLKVANSSFFGSSKSINAVHEAVVLIGLDNMKNIVYSVSSSGLLTKRLKNYQYADQGFWLHSMAVAVTCRILVEGNPNSPINSEEAFVAGLLHDIGKLILDNFLDAESGPRDVSISEEKEALGVSHCKLAEVILKKWRIPQSIQSAVRHHHEPDVQSAEQHGAVLVNLADRLCNGWNIGVNSLMDLGAEIDKAEFDAELQALDFKSDQFNETLYLLRKKLATLDKFYEEA
ncbi:MAG: HDOD domain-containing protein [bacterium]|nr:HDOD domain-containing protein [bacterium]